MREGAQGGEAQLRGEEMSRGKCVNLPAVGRDVCTGPAAERNESDPGSEKGKEEKREKGRSERLSRKGGKWCGRGGVWGWGREDGNGDTQ